MRALFSLVLVVAVAALTWLLVAVEGDEPADESGAVTGLAPNESPPRSPLDALPPEASDEPPHEPADARSTEPLVAPREEPESATPRSSVPNVVQVGGRLPVWLGPGSEAGAFPEDPEPSDEPDTRVYSALLDAQLDEGWAREASPRVRVSIWELEDEAIDRDWRPKGEPTFALPFPVTEERTVEVPFRNFDASRKFVEMTVSWKEQGEDRSEVIWSGFAD